MMAGSTGNTIVALARTPPAASTCTSNVAGLPAQAGIEIESVSKTRHADRRHMARLYRREESTARRIDRHQERYARMRDVPRTVISPCSDERRVLLNAHREPGICATGRGIPSHHGAVMQLRDGQGPSRSDLRCSIPCRLPGGACARLDETLDDHLKGRQADVPIR